MNASPGNRFVIDAVSAASLAFELSDAAREVGLDRRIDTLALKVALEGVFLRRHDAAERSAVANG